jgi:hypothetical protein
MFTWTQKAGKKGNLELIPARHLTEYNRVKAPCEIHQGIKWPDWSNKPSSDTIPTHPEV